MKSLTVGVVGAGDISRKVHLPVLLNMPNVQVQWIIDSRAERTRAVARAYGLRAVPQCAAEDLPACDVALIAIPIGARAAYYDAFAARRTAVLAEKPFARSSAEHKALTDRFAPSQLACGYMRRFYASSQLLRELVRRQPFGQLIRMGISEGNRSTGSRVDRSYLDDPHQSASGGILSELGCHTLDLALFITGASAYEAQACELVFDGRVDRKVSATIKLTGSDYLPDLGLPLEYCVSWLDRQTNTITLEFEKSTVWAELQPGGRVRIGTPCRALAAIELAMAGGAATTANQAFFLQWRSFFQGVMANTESEISARSALLGTALIEDLYSLGARRG